MKRSEAIQEAKKTGQAVEYMREYDNYCTNNPNVDVPVEKFYSIKFAQVAELRNKRGELELQVVSDDTFDTYEEAVEDILNYYNTLQEAQVESGTMIALVEVVEEFFHSINYDDCEYISDIVRIL
jgi:hypothetical protein